MNDTLEMLYNMQSKVVNLEASALLFEFHQLANELRELETDISSIIMQLEQDSKKADVVELRPQFNEIKRKLEDE